MNISLSRFLLVCLLAVLTGIASVSHSQVPTVGDCLGAIPVCEDYYFQPNTSSGTGSYPNEVPGSMTCPYECLDGEANSTWYRFTVQEAGILGFIISPIDINDDYDWAVYNLTDHRCSDILYMSDEICVSCNSAGGAGLHGETGAYSGPDGCAGPGNQNGNTKWNIEIPVEQGETYVLYISDWTQSPTGYSLDFSSSTAVIFDDVPPALDSVFYEDITGCQEDQLTFKFTENVSCDRVIASMFDVTGPGGPYDVIDVYGAACDVGGEWEIEFTLTLDKPFATNGHYKLLLNSGINGVVDACNNIAPSDTLPFTLALGAPVIIQIGLTITNSTCGVSNGAVTGLAVTGQGALTFIWTNQAGDTVGTSLDLYNVPAGNYSLEVSDNYNCVTHAGPYQVQDEGAPEIDESQIAIAASYCEDPNGTISGLLVTGTAPFTYEWLDMGGTTVGSDLDLWGVPEGLYTLTVTDVNGCEVVSGPHAVPGFPGPTLVEDYMEILPSTCNEANGSITGIFSSGSTALDYTWYDGGGNPVGTNIDLLNAPAGQYTILIQDANGCDTIGGPYLIGDNPPATVDEAAMTVTPSTCGNPDGAISGLSVSGSSPFTYEWLDENNVTVGTSLDLSGVPGGQYTLLVFDVNTCETESGPHMVPDEGGPEVETSAMVITPVNCHGSDGLIEGITVTGNAPFTYSWKDDEGNEVGTLLDLSGVPEGNYTLEAEDVNGCKSYSGPYFIGNIGGADITSVQSLNPMCEEPNGEITVEATGGLGNLEYSIDGGQSWQGGGEFTGLLPGDFTVQVRDEHGCMTEYGTLTLQNEGQQVVATAGGNSPVCEGDRLELSCDISGAQYEWQGPNGFTSTEQNPVIAAATLQSAGTYTVTVTTQPYNCQGIATTEIEVTESFEMQLTVTASANPIYQGEDVEFTVTPDPQGFPGIYTWYLDGVEVQSGTSSAWANSNLMDGQKVYCALATNSGCILNNPAYSNEVVMDVKELPMYFPNSIRPNSILTENREFRPRTSLGNISEYKLRIYNKWGQEVFKSEDVNKGWDGTINGKTAPVGTYVYLVTYQLEGNASKEGEKFEKKGSFVLVD
ncbi:MAG: gliding motility-associated C-terminal domain-containing protein [Bacteroidetes bacterium]|nr:gliding motility-associated C-terminal domain-containing protein [Bacteroidota bacterium]